MYRFALPVPPLQPFIESYWWIRAGANPLTLHERVFVDAKADLLFNFGVAYTREHLDSTGVQRQLPISNFDAQRDYPVAIMQVGQVDLLAVRFRAGGGAAFMPIPAYELTNFTLTPADVFGAAIGDLEERLYEARQHVPTQINLLDAFFLARLAPTPAMRVSWHIAQRLEATAGTLAITDLARDMGYSIRSIDRIFRQHYGISPKFFARIARMQRALALLAVAAPDVTLARLALEIGFYDHAHLTREFQALTAHTPDSYRVYLAQRSADPPPNLAPLLPEKS
jgi:AraC-like DNA-binding protein